ncbi:phospholipase D delta [Citrus sinensis]|nr:phospholipase D delta [Citrus sinensis]
MAAGDDSDKEKVIYLHGDLDLKIIRARRLPNMDMIKIIRKSKIITSDPYVTVVVPQATVARTRVLKNSQEPVWNEHFIIPLAHPLVNLEIQVKDDDVFGAQIIGTAAIPADTIATGEFISRWYDIIAPSGSPPKPGASIQLELKFTPCDKNPLYRHGIAGDPEQKGVRNTYFPLRKGSHVRLYQDAHVSEGIFPEIPLDDGKLYKPGTCWEDICHAISEAHHLIYIVGWSVFHKIKLIREPTRPLPRGGDLTLGELLKYKSEEGVRVLLLIWDDKTSHDKLGVKTAGVMATHDEETKKFFKHSSVNCVLAPRYASSKLSYFKQQIVGTIFTHHQKCVLVDTQASGNNRKITAFIGGIDLCDGRYDTPEHRLFRDLDTVFKDDFHNPTYPIGTKAPREPWHDLHCRLDGPAAYDVLINFEQRWRKATKLTELTFKFKRVSHWRDDYLIKIGRISWILSPELSLKTNGTTIVPRDDNVVRVSKEDDPENWHVQSLICAKDVVIDKSIQTAYIQAIRSAQHFIYIENQYFLGSSYAWPSYKNAADNLIPMELALKIASKIRANERFAVYVIIPMWPEGDPKTNTVQEILFWQSQTMQMMYSVVAQELREMQVDAHPQDYLSFYCLGKREEAPKDVLANNVDDEYVIMGSANINQRSMAGSKDTEIAMGSYQPHHTWARKLKHPHGQIYGYRKSLWSEHLGMLDNCFEEPESLDCIRKVNQIAGENWGRFTAMEFTPLQGHLLRYPLQVDADGTVSPLPGYEQFPDAGGKIIGVHSMSLPDMLTT